MLVEQGAELVSECQTPPLFTLLHLGNYPGLIRGGNTAVRGEVYRLNSSALDRLDQFEGHPTVFRRELLITDRSTSKEEARQAETCSPTSTEVWMCCPQVTGKSDGDRLEGGSYESVCNVSELWAGII